MNRGFGSYYSSVKNVPVQATAPGYGPVHHVSGLGAYYASPLIRPVTPLQPGFEEVQSTQGLGEMSEGTKALFAIVTLIVLGFVLNAGRSR